MKKRVLLFICLLSFAQLYSQQGTWTIFINGENITSVSGSENNTWVGTTAGLVKIAQSNNTPSFYFNTNSGLVTNAINDVAVKDNNIWIATELGLQHYNWSSWEFFNEYNSGLANNWVHAVAVDNTGKVWAGTEWGLSTYVPNTWQTFTENNAYMPSNHVITVKNEPDGHIWFGLEEVYGNPWHLLWGNFYRVDDDAWTNFYVPQIPLPDFVRLADIHDISSGSEFTWIATENGLYRWNKANNTTIVFDTLNSQIPDDFATCLVMDSDDYLYVGTARGLAKVVDETVVPVSFPDSAMNNAYITALYKDPSGEIWVGTKNFGLYKLTEDFEKMQTSNSGLPTNEINGWAVDDDNTKWIGTDKGLVKFDDSVWTTFNTGNSSLECNEIIALYCDSQNKIWIGTECGVYLFDQGNMQLFADSINAVSISGKGGEVWFATHEGLYHFSGGAIAFFNKENSALTSNEITDVRCNAPGEVYLESYHYIDIYNSYYKISMFDGELSDSITSQWSYAYTMDVDAENNLWFAGTWYGASGIFKYTHSTAEIIYFDYPEVNYDISFRGMYCDDDGSIWCGVLEPEALLMFDGTNWTTYSEENSGMPIGKIFHTLVDHHQNVFIAGPYSLYWASLYQGIGVMYAEPNVVFEEANIENGNIRIYPNPSTGHVKFSFETPRENVRWLAVFDLNGKEMLSLPANGDFDGNIDLANLPKGVYVIRVDFTSHSESNKLILK